MLRLFAVSLALSITAVFLFLTFGLRATWLDHSTDSRLRQELVNRSKQGLALVRSLDGSTIELLFFDGHKETRSIEGELFRGSRVMGNWIVAVGLTGSLADSQMAYPSAGPVVLRDVQGAGVARSVLRIRSNQVIVSPDGLNFAFIGVPENFPDTEDGLYVGNFQDEEFTELQRWGLSPEHEVSPAMRADLDWSPDGKEMVLSRRGRIMVFTLASGKRRLVGMGGRARWAPTGHTISYLSPNHEASLLDLTTGKSTTIDPGRESGTSPQWSPDGRYLLIGETAGSHVAYGCEWVYDVVNRTWMPLDRYGVGGTQWIQLSIEGPPSLNRLK